MVLPQLMQGYRVLHDTADPLPAFAACLFDREATEGEQEIYAREEAILDASYWNGKTSTRYVPVLLRSMHVVQHVH